MLVQIAKDIGAYTFDKVAKTITITGVTIPSLSDFRVIANATSTTEMYNFVVPTKGATWVSATGVLTLEYDTSAMANTDELVILVNIGDPTTDFTIDSNKVSEQSPIWSRYTSPEALISAAQAFTTSFADIGPEVDSAGYHYCRYWFTLDINQGANARIKILEKHTYAGAEEYPVAPDRVTISAPATYYETVGAANAQYWEIDTDADQLFTMCVQCNNATPYIQVQIQIGVDGGTDAEIDALYVTKGY